MSARPHPLSLRGKRLALRYAWQGTRFMLRTQPNAWFQIGIAIVVTVVGIAMELTAGEWCAAVLAMAGVWVAEALNTAIEAVVDLASPQQHPLAGQAKDVAAGAVFVATAAAGVVGLIVFGPRFWVLFFG
jgi:diacylglycerol kinase (ATP)